MEKASSSRPNIGELEWEPAREVVGQKPHCLFIAGAWGTNAGIRGIKEGLERSYGVGKVEVFNSIFSTDPQNPNRFEQMADNIQKHVKEGLDIVTHSLGAAELRRSIKKITEKDPTFFDRKENTENLHIVLVSPGGFNKGIIASFRYLGRTLRFNRKEGGWPIFSKLETLHRGIDALTAFPPEGITSSDLACAMQEAMPELSQYREGVEKIPLEEEKNNIFHLSQDQKEKFTDYSQMMRTAIENKNYAGLRHLVASYGKILFPLLNEVYAGNFESVKVQGLEATKATMGAYIGSIRTLVNSFGSTPMKEIAKLQRKGVSVDFIIPEYDIFMRLDQAISFFEGPDEASQHVKIGVGRTHQFPALQAMRFGETIKNLSQDNVS